MDTAHEVNVLGRCCADLEKFISVADDYDLDEMAVQSLRTAIECMRERANRLAIQPSLCPCGSSLCNGEEDEA
jgi:hypothetical protein